VLRLKPEPALSLAALRVVVPTMLLIAPGFREGARVAAWDPARRIAPEGLGWFAAHVPISPGLATAAQVVTAFAAISAMLGFSARVSLAVLTLSSFYLYSIAQLAGWVWHDMHLLWFAALLAASPCADVLAIDARRPIDAQGVAYAPALLFARLLLGAIYFFPGAHKLASSGLAWALSDNLRNQLWWKWAQHGFVPELRVDRVPGLLEASGLFVLAFELSFPALVLLPKTRPIAAVLGVCFHLMSRLIFRIPFESLWLCYVVLVDLRPLARKLPLRRPEGRASASSSGRAAWLAGALLLAGAVVQGIRGQMQSYPFACYPTFQWRAASTMPDLAIYAVDAGGQERELAHARVRGYRTQRQWAEIWSLAGVTAPVRPDRLKAYYRTAVAHRARVERVRFYRVRRSVVPEERARPPVSRELLLELVTR
jgi:hypothetical protein